jgi:hypothetical protein
VYSTAATSPLSGEGCEPNRVRAGNRMTRIDMGERQGRPLYSVDGNFK